MWFLSPSGWPTFADTAEEQAVLTAAGYVPMDVSQVQPAIDAYHAGSPAPAVPDFVTVDELQTPTSPASVALKAASGTYSGNRSWTGAQTFTGAVDFTGADVTGLTGAGNATLFVLPASNGTDDLPAIQAVLDEALTKPISVLGRPGETYTLSDALVIRSNTYLGMAGCVINGNPAKNLVKNAAVIPARTVADAATIAGSAAVTSATANFTAGDRGKAVQVLRAGPNFGNGTAPGSLYGTIVSVDSATQVTLSQPATITRTGATLNVFPARDSNIAVVGGTWNGGQKDATSQVLDGHGMLFRRVDGLTVLPRKMTNTRTTKGGGYAIAPGDVTRANIYGVDGNVGSALVQFQGPAKYLSVHQLTGTCGDDMVAFVGVDGQSVTDSQLGDVEGDITDFSVADIHSDNSWTSLKLAAGTGANGVQRKIARFQARGFTGTCQQGVVNIVDYAGPTWVEGQLRDISAIPGAGFASVTVGATNAKSVRIDGLPFDASKVTPTVGIVNVTAPCQDLQIDGLTIFGAPAADGIGVRVAASITALRLGRLRALDTGTLGQKSVSGITVQAANVSVGQITISDVHRDALSTNLVQIDATATGLNLGELIVSDGYQLATSVINSSADSANKARVRISNWRQPQGALVGATFPCDVYTSNVEVAPTSGGNPGGGAVRANSAAATPVRVRAVNTVVTGASTSLLSRTATQAISANGPSATADLSILTPQDGDIVYNTNAALSCGTGPAVFHTGGTGNGWKNLYSGATY